MKVLYIVDLQNDFLPNGSLAVPNGNEVIPYILKILNENEYDRIIVSEDWHPCTHTSFAKNHNIEPFNEMNGEIKWPVHCVQYTRGACIQEDVHNKLLELESNGVDIVYLSKGEDPNREEYSVDIYHLDSVLTKDTVGINVVGLATDYCVKHTALSLLELQLDVTVDLNGCRGVSEDSSRDAVLEMKNAGINIIGEIQ